MLLVAEQLNYNFYLGFSFVLLLPISITSKPIEWFGYCNVSRLQSLMKGVHIPMHITQVFYNAFSKVHLMAHKHHIFFFQAADNVIVQAIFLGVDVSE